MASYQLNLARLRNCPPVAALAKAVAAFGLPKDEEFGVLSHSATDHAVFATLVRKTQAAVTRLDEQTGEVTTAAVEKATVYPLAVKPRAELLETYAGSETGLEQVGVFLASCLQLPVVVEPIELDIPAALDKLARQAPKFQLRSLRVSDYAHNSFMSGLYAPKFLDSQHGMEFLEEYADSAMAASVRFTAQAGRATVTLRPKACFRFSCGEEDLAEVQSLLRKLT